MKNVQENNELRYWRVPVPVLDKLGENKQEEQHLSVGQSASIIGVEEGRANNTHKRAQLLQKQNKGSHKNGEYKENQHSGF